MKVIFRLFPLLLLFNLSCKDDLPPVKKMTYDVTFQINFTVDGVPYSKSYGKDSTNMAEEFGPNLVNGDYYSNCIISYNLAKGPNPLYIHEFNILIGAHHGNSKQDWTGTYQSFKSNFEPGDKSYDHMLHDQPTLPNRVEIEFRDEHGESWYSTKYSRLPYTTEIIQPSGKFTITEMREIKNELNEDALLIVKGTFNCTLYEWEGPGVKDLQNGSFVALVRLPR